MDFEISQHLIYVAILFCLIIILFYLFYKLYLKTNDNTDKLDKLDKLLAEIFIYLKNLRLHLRLQNPKNRQNNKPKKKKKM